MFLDGMSALRDEKKKKIRLDHLWMVLSSRDLNYSWLNHGCKQQNFLK